MLLFGESWITCGITSKGPCRSSKTNGINMALGNDYLVSQGLVSLRNIWINIHYGRPTAHCTSC
ncbi:Retron-type RNA-directed DNA polymerase [Pseudoalteromonas tunicata]|nr:Retron-type RNA-directed DNA polymerase [Pseudoalteromonas tunicata]